jgi:hypothetical protein
MKTKIERQKPSDAKLRELILYIAMRCEDDESFGAVKLNKLLFYADFTAYKRFGRSITGHEYQALPQGPCPRAMVPILRKMKRDGELVTQIRDYYGLKQHRPIALRDADLKLFGAAEISLVDGLIEKHRGASAADISLESHRFIGWKLARAGESIPYAVALVSKRPLTPQEEAYAWSLDSMAKECLKKNGR